MDGWKWGGMSQTHSFLSPTPTYTHWHTHFTCVTHKSHTQDSGPLPSPCPTSSCPSPTTAPRPVHSQHLRPHTPGLPRLCRLLPDVGYIPSASELPTEAGARPKWDQEGSPCLKPPECGASTSVESRPSPALADPPQPTCRVPRSLGCPHAFAHAVRCLGCPAPSHPQSPAPSWVSSKHLVSLSSHFLPSWVDPSVTSSRPWCLLIHLCIPPWSQPYPAQSPADAGPVNRSSSATPMCAVWGRGTSPQEAQGPILECPPQTHPLFRHASL